MKLCRQASYFSYDRLCLFFCSVIQSFETVVSIYAQQLPLNENQTFVMPSLTLVAELVSTCVIIGYSVCIGVHL